MYHWNNARASRSRPHRIIAADRSWGSSTARRGTDRVPFDGRIIVKSGSTQLHGIAGNISPGGAFVRTEKPPPVGMEVTLLVRLDRRMSLHITGIVRWHELDSHLYPIGFGVQFINIGDGFRDWINRLVESTREFDHGEAADDFFFERRTAGA
ncbi:MAG: PilZ domain-containing protein [Myxococcota bacterium]|nr:PilZ domain-containing protein [Myxococcota bacterium]